MNELTNLQTFDIGTMMSADAMASMLGAFEQAEQSLGGTDVAVMGFKGRSFYIKTGGSSVELPTRNIDVYLLGINADDHVTFHKTKYDGENTEAERDAFTRFIRKADKKTKEWEAGDHMEAGQYYASRTRKRRAVLMLASDTEQRLIIADLGELSIYAPRDTNLGLFSLQQLMKQFATMRKHNPRALPFLFKLQMLFTPDSVPVVQFSFIDQLNRGTQVRLADEQAINRITKAWQDGEVERLLNLWIEPADAVAGNNAQTTPVAQPAPVPPLVPSDVVTQAPVAPVAPVAQPAPAAVTPVMDSL